MMRIIALFTVAMLAALPAPAQEVVVGPESRAEVALTVYGGGLALVRETRRATLAAGETALVI